MPIFDRYIAVDWSAANSRSGGGKGQKDSIWISEAFRVGDQVTLLPSENPRTRSEAMASIECRLASARTVDQRVLIGFDFPFGYPQGSAQLLGAGPRWDGLWSMMATRVRDEIDNASNRFELAAEINRGLRPRGPMYWGHAAVAYDGLGSGKAGLDYTGTSEKRIAEQTSKSASPVWQLNGAGCVGGQALLGIARLEALRRSSRVSADIAIWPFETDFDRDLSKPIVVAEIYPSIFEYDYSMFPPDKAQVEAVAKSFASYDDHDRLVELLSSPADLSVEQRNVALEEEGWIVGVSRERTASRSKIAPVSGELAPKSTRRMTYVREPDAIYAQSFATIRAEADLSHLPPALHDVAIRMIHACGMVDLSADIVGSAAIVEAVKHSLGKGGAILCDCEMVRSGIIRRYLPQTAELVVTLNDPTVPDLARQLGTTRSAASVELWRPRLENSIVVIGNAPTALFHLIEVLAAGAPRPAAIIATPVGFVGAAESKALLVADSFSIPFVTITGRRGGSAIASAALNAISKGAWA